MKHLLWPLLRVVALVLLVIVSTSGFLKAALRALTGANQIPPPPFGCLLQFLTLPISVPIMLMYFTSARLYLEIIVLDVKLGFAKPKEGLRVAAQTFPKNYGYWCTRFLRQETEEDPSAGEAEEPAPEVEVSKAEILEEMCESGGLFRITLRGTNRLTHGELNIIRSKVNPLSVWPQRVFPVTEQTSEEKINRWLNHPMINVPVPDRLVMKVAEQTPLPAVTLERILRKLLQEDYDRYWIMAEWQIKSKK